jgi:hypothetical protein
MLVNESLNEYHYNIETNKLLEGFDLKNITNPSDTFKTLIRRLNNTSNTKIKINIVKVLIFLLGTMAPNSDQKPVKTDNNSIINYYIKEHPTIDENDIFYLMKTLRGHKQLKQIEITPSQINKLNLIVNNRFNISKINSYNKFDIDIIQASNELKLAGEKPNIKLIKAIMLIETGMIPRKNNLGYEGFPQTKMKILNHINNKYSTQFVKADLYDPQKSTKIIHYIIKAISKSKYVKNHQDIVGSYNWGLGNWSKYKLGKKTLPDETNDYIKMISSILK